MSPLLRKEIRLILPFWAIALVLAIVPVWVADAAPAWRLHESIYWTLCFGLMLLGLAPFGQEFSLGTFSALLAQPFGRRRFWNVKMLVLLGAAAVVFLAFLLSHFARIETELRQQSLDFAQRQQQPGGIFTTFNLANHEEANRQEAWAGFWYAARAGFLLLIVAVTGGLWTTLLFRQTGAALWFSILIPGVLIVVVDTVFQRFSGTVQNVMHTAVLGGYSLAGLVWAWRMFAGAQDSQWLGETIAVLSLKSTKVHDDSVAPRRKAAIRALLRKEFQSHQISLLIAFGLLMLHVCTLIFRGVYVLPRNSEMRFTVEAVPLLWLLIPWLMGCVAIAEERKLGTMEGQLCLPVKRSTQFVVKLLMVLTLGVLLGGLMPALVEAVGSWAGISSEIVKSLLSPGNGTYFASVFELVISAGLIALISLFASSLTRNTLHALGAAVVVGMAWVFLFSWVGQQASRSYDYSFWKGPLIVFVGVAVSILAVLALSFSNYKTLHAGRRVWLRTFAILAFTLIATGFATAVIYQRPWELMMSPEPQHGAAVLSGPVRPALYMPGGRVVALLPDGRIWVASDFQVSKSNGTFVGSNWVALATSDTGGDVDALRSDGTLWSILSFADRTNSGVPLTWMQVKPNPRRIGSDSDWKTVVSVEVGFLAVKSNGTLWGWAQNPEGQFGTARKMYEPTRIGNDSDWETIFPQEYDALLMKRDGSIWTSASGIVFPGVRYIQTALNGADWVEICGANNYHLVVKREGSLWEWGLPGDDAFGLRPTGERNSSGMARLGNDSNWMRISGYPTELVALKGGRLVKNGLVPFANSLGRPSAYSDWLTVDAYQNSLIGLAADGTLSMWEEQYTDAYQLFLGPTHRPAWSVNILTDSKK